MLHIGVDELSYDEQGRHCLPLILADAVDFEVISPTALAFDCLYPLTF